jgi:GNAT superfamily N-acetyltransferase
MSKTPEIVRADLARPEHQRDIVALTVAYAADAMGGGQRLPEDVIERLIPGLQRHPTTLVFLAYFDRAAIGIATCFYGFSTFTARPVINVHDLAVLPEHRSRGTGRALLQAVERAARETGCAAITLEVQERNTRARRVYEAAGFTQGTCGDENGGILFYKKEL